MSSHSLKKFNKPVQVLSVAMTSVQHRCLNYVLHQFRDELNKDEEPSKDVFIPISQITEKDCEGSNLKKLRDNMKSLFEIVFEEIDKTAKKYTAYTAFTKVKYVEGERSFLLRCNDEFIEACKDYYKAGGYITYDQEDILKIKSAYSLKFYELFKLYIETNRTEVTKSVEWIRSWLAIDINKHKDMRNFKRYIIKKPQEELRSKKLLSFEFETVKRGRRITAFRFYNIHEMKDVSSEKHTENTKDQKVNPDTDTQKESIDKSGEILVKAGVSFSRAFEIAEKYPLIFIETIPSKIPAKIKNPGGFISKNIGDMFKEWEIRKANKTPHKNRIEQERKREEEKQRAIEEKYKKAERLWENLTPDEQEEKRKIYNSNELSFIPEHIKKANIISNWAQAETNIFDT